MATAETFLLAAGKTPGSPQLNSFGPNMRLVVELLALGTRDAVLQYFDDCKVFWHRPRVAAAGGPQSSWVLLDSWATVVRDGGVPDFGPNLVY